MVLEVDHSYGSPQVLREKMELWLSSHTEVNIFFGLKIFDYVAAKGGRRMVLLYGEKRGNSIVSHKYEVGDYAPEGSELGYPGQINTPVYLVLGRPEEECERTFIHFNVDKWINYVKFFSNLVEGIQHP